MYNIYWTPVCWCVCLVDTLFVVFYIWLLDCLYFAVYQLHELIRAPKTCQIQTYYYINRPSEKTLKRSPPLWFLTGPYHPQPTDRLGLLDFAFAEMTY